MGGLLGAFHLTEIPEILLENQMEHVNFWNDVSLISASLTLPLKSLLSVFAKINPDSRHWNGREHAILVLVVVFAQKTFGKQKRWLGNVLMNVKISKLLEFPICGQPREIVRNIRNSIPEINVFHLFGLIPTHPVNISCGRKREYAEKTQDFRWRVEPTWVRSGNRTHYLKRWKMLALTVARPKPLKTN